MSERSCPNCGAPNREGANYCAACGHYLAAQHHAAHQLTGSARGEGDDAPTRPTGNPAASDGIEDQHTLPIARSIDFRVGRQTHAGRVRELNEDSLLTFALTISNESTARPAGLFVVADGIGGHEGGEIASGMLVGALARRAGGWLASAAGAGGAFDAETWLAEAIEAGNEAIYARAKTAGYEMGTTVVAALVEGERAVIAHVGDSRAYRVNDGGIERLTADHSLVESMVAAHQITPDEARRHPQANVIYRTVGDQPQVSVDLKQVALSSGDRLLLCSDGLSNMLVDEAIHELVMSAASPQAAADALVDAANEAGGEDNCTVVIVELRLA